MPLWQRLLITLAVMLVASYLVGLLWQWMFTADIPSYLSGAVGGISAVPTWEFLRRILPKHYRRRNCVAVPSRSCRREIADIYPFLPWLSAG
jgi:hypothetical protein